MKKLAKQVRMRFQKISYVLDDAFQIIERHPMGEVEIEARLNPDGTYSITDRQLNRATARRGLRWSGDIENTIFAVDRQGRPVCELVRLW